MALTISRKPGEAVVVAGPCTIRVAHSRGSRRVRLQITAPEDVEIMREELIVKRARQALEPRGHITDRDLRAAGIR